MREPGMIQGLAVALMLAGVAAGCGKTPVGGAKKIPRDKDAQAVIVVEAPGESSIELSSEQEPNGELGQATALAPLAVSTARGARGSLDSDLDVDMYRVEVPSEGVLGARLGGIEGVDLILDLLDAEGTRLARSDRGPANVEEGIANYPVAKGTYVLAVSEFVRGRSSARSRRKKGNKGKSEPPPEPKRVGASPAYELVARLAAGPAKDFEVEPNDDASRAIEVLVGDEMLGYMGWAGDEDVWKLSIEGLTPRYGIDLDIQGVPVATLQLQLVDSGGGKVLARNGEEGTGVSVRNLVVVPEGPAGGGDGRAGKTQAPPGYLYARISAKRSNPLEPYRLRMSTRLLELDQETEPNDQPATAVAIREDASARSGTRRGYLTHGDVDHYRVDVGAEPVYLSLGVKPSQPLVAKLELGLEVSVDGAVAGAAASKGRAENVLRDVRLEAGKTAIIAIAGRGDVGEDAAYELDWSLELAGRAPLGTDEPGLDDSTLMDQYED